MLHWPNVTYIILENLIYCWFNTGAEGPRAICSVSQIQCIGNIDYCNIFTKKWGKHSYFVLIKSWLLFNAKWAIFSCVMMRTSCISMKYWCCPFCTFSWISIVLAYWQQSVDRRINALRHIILIPSQPIFAIAP